MTLKSTLDEEIQTARNVNQWTIEERFEALKIENQGFLRGLLHIKQIIEDLEGLDYF